MITCDVCGREVSKTDWVEKMLKLKVGGRKLIGTVMFCLSCAKPLDDILEELEMRATTNYLQEKNPKLLEKLKEEWLK